MAAKKKDEAGKVMDRLRDLVNLARDKDPEEATEESRTAAVKALHLMKEHDLVIVSKAELERVQQRIDGLARAAQEAGQQKMVLGLAMGFFGAKFMKF